MEITLSPKSLRAAHLFSRLEMIRFKHLNGSFDCVICNNGGRSIYAAFKKYEEPIAELGNEHEAALTRCGSKKEKEAVITAFFERHQKLIKEFPFEKLGGVWKDIFEMIQEEGLDQRDFISWCREYFRKHPYAHHGCHFANSGWEGWLYSAAQGETAK